MIVTTYNVWRGLRKEIKLHHVNEPVTSQLLLCMAQFKEAEFLVVKENYADTDTVTVGKAVTTTITQPSLERSCSGQVFTR